ncbi:PAS domain S-box protein [Goodfellowiella coeruleoviolacea]|uniref:PAS domain S-box-containing protein n=1 Tax=Goodfellowiella coeruleoviolacea TaxID=334858 RepID=A0AAE3GIE4_9PSEU|nr:PAS domain S-box protein [Goodfellowiella coeruleoviolacea]MCP2166723.1 PAS domain S-box-containing protein [Goodfellowiella coeruleoviolacea]
MSTAEAMPNRHRVARALRLSTQRFRAVFSCSTIGIAVTDLDGRWVAANTALDEILGHDLAPDRVLVDLLHPDDADLLAAAYQRVASGQVSRSRERYRLVRATGELVWVVLTVSLLPSTGHGPAYHVTLVEPRAELVPLPGGRSGAR